MATLRLCPTHGDRCRPITYGNGNRRLIFILLPPRYLLTSYARFLAEVHSVATDFFKQVLLTILTSKYKLVCILRMEPLSAGTES